MNVKIKGVNHLMNTVFNYDKNLKAQINALNKIAVIARTGSQSRIQSEYNIPSEIPHKEKSIAIDKAAPQRMSAYLVSSSKKMRMGAFPAEDTSKGVKVFIKKGRATIAKKKGNSNKTFLGTPSGRDWSKYGQTRTNSYGKRMVLIRKGNKAYSVSTKGLNGPSMGQLLTRKDNMAAINRTIKQRMPILLKQEREKLGIRSR